MTIKKCPECNEDINTRAKVCPHCDARRSLTSTVALWAGRIALICIAGVVSILSGLSLVVRFFVGTEMPMFALIYWARTPAGVVANFYHYCPVKRTG